MPGPAEPNTIVFVCGPDGMMKVRLCVLKTAVHSRFDKHLPNDMIQLVSGTKNPDYTQGEVGGLLKVRYR